jgi:hypothetical protein
MGRQMFADSCFGKCFSARQAFTLGFEFFLHNDDFNFIKLAF